MSDIDFQNGFVCGMATKGLTRGGEYYKPECWNDSGVYGYFYIDFRHAMEDFSKGMWDESILVYDSVQVPVTGVEYVSTGVYKVYANISGKIHGITVLNKATSRLRFATGMRLPVFSVHFWVGGIDHYDDIAYLYDQPLLPVYKLEHTNDSGTIGLDDGPVSMDSPYDSFSFNSAYILGSTNEKTMTVVLK